MALFVEPQDIDRLAAGEPLDFGDDARLRPHDLSAEQMKKMRAGEPVPVRIFTPEGHRMVVLQRGGQGGQPDARPQRARDHANRARSLLDRARQAPEADPTLIANASAHAMTAIALGLFDLVADADPQHLVTLAEALTAIAASRS